MLIANIAVDRERAHGRLLVDSSLDVVGRMLIELEEEATTLLPKMAGGELRFVRTGTFRYVGQGSSISVSLPQRDEWRDVTSEDLAERFGQAYGQMYARRHDDVAAELVDLRVVAELKPPKQFSPVVLGARSGGSVADGQSGVREVYFSSHGFLKVPVYDRYRLKANDVILGPGIVEERETTTVFGPDSSLKVDRYGCLVISL
jgi:N-methylhydantoinase A/oxoprolinase/acetone carboxylase beta subunit